MGRGDGSMPNSVAAAMAATVSAIAVATVDARAVKAICRNIWDLDYCPKLPNCQWFHPPGEEWHKCPERRRDEAWQAWLAKKAKMDVDVAACGSWGPLGSHYQDPAGISAPLSP